MGSAVSLQDDWKASLIRLPNLTLTIACSLFAERFESTHQAVKAGIGDADADGSRCRVQDDWKALLNLTRLMHLTLPITCSSFAG